MVRGKLPSSGDVVGGYTLVRLVGEGGMGVVFEARDGGGETLAVKILRPERAASEEAVEEFRLEARSTAAARHDSVVRMLECGVEDDLHYLVMEFVDGPPLDRLLDRRGALPWRAAVRIGIQVASALAHAHTQGFLHRDVKPGNILLSRDGRARLTDFGIVKDIGSLKGFLVKGRKVGTAAYASPEQCRGRRLGPPTDLYSLGATLYHMVCGRPPFCGGGSREVAARQVTEDPIAPIELAPEIPRPLSNLIRKMLAKSPLLRPDSMETLVRSLRMILEGRLDLGPAGPTTSSRPSRSALAGLRSRRTAAQRARA